MTDEFEVCKIFEDKHADRIEIKFGVWDRRINPLWPTMCVITSIFIDKRVFKREVLDWLKNRGDVG